MSPARVIATSFGAALALVWLTVMAVVGQQRTEAHRVANIETISMAERGTR